VGRCFWLRPAQEQVGRPRRTGVGAQWGSAIQAEGGCFCGQVRYRATAAPLYQTICHCASCQRASGALAVAWVIFPLDHFALLQGPRPAPVPGVGRAPRSTRGALGEARLALRAQCRIENPLYVPVGASQL
jgi:hypothetical protein